jgi:hypothetical protein
MKKKDPVQDLIDEWNTAAQRVAIAAFSYVDTAPGNRGVYLDDLKQSIDRWRKLQNELVSIASGGSRGA